MASRPESPARLVRRAGAVLLATVGIAAALAGCGSSSSDSTAKPDAAKATEIQGITRPKPLVVGNLTLPQVAPDGTETPFAFKAPKGKVLFAAFGYTNCPDVCPTTLSDISKAIRQLGADGKRVEVAFATVDPERDTAKVMNQYLGSFVKGGHPLRTTDMAAFGKVQDGFQIDSSVDKQPDGTVEVSHTARSFVVDDTGHIAVEWTFGTTYKTMASDLRILLARAGT